MIEQGKYKPRIFRQGLILILLPFSVVSVVLLLLTQLCINQEKLSELEQNQSQTLGRCMDTFNEWGEDAAALIGRAFTNDESYVNQTKDIVPELKRRFAAIRSVPTTSSMPASAEKMESMCMETIYDLMALPRASSSDPMSNYVNLQKIPGIIRKIYVLPAKAKALLESEWKALLRERNKQDMQLRLMKFTALTFLAGNIILSITLIWYFARGITSRLQLVTENASRLPRLEKQSANIGGNDELAYLAAVLDDASDKLIAAAEHRRAIFGMVAHDMRSPITAGQLTLDLVQESIELSSGAANNDIAIAQERLKGTLKHVNDLLAIEKEKDLDKPNTSDPEEPALPPDSVAPVDPITNEHELPGKSRNIIACMFFSPGIFHKVLWLVLIPLLLQSIFVLLLLQQMRFNEALIAEERQQSFITLNVNLMFLDSLKATVSELIYMLNNDSKIRPVVLKNFEAVDHEVSVLATLLADADDERLGCLKNWRKLLRGFSTQVKTFHVENKTKLSNKLMENIKVFRPLQKKALKIRAQARKIFDSENQETQALREQQQESRQKITQILFVGLIANFFVSMLMFVAFSRDVSSRLKRVVQNAADLGRTEKTLPDLLPGKDELAYLDLILRHTKEKLNFAAQERATMMKLIAEDMQNPLKEAQSALRSFRQEKGSDLNDRMNKQLKRGQSNIDRVLLLIKDLLTMETLETGKVGLERSQVQLVELVDESLAIVASLAADKKIQLANECSNVEIWVDRARLIQTLINYLSNAIKFSSAETKIVVSNSLSDDRVRVNVIDQGPGMDEQTRQRVFERFFQAEGAEKKQGYGLGLAICSLIIESHDGKLGVDSELGKGSCFWFELSTKNSKPG